MKSHHVQIVSKPAAERIRSRLEGDGFRIGSAPHALFEAIGSDVRVTFYPKRGKLLIQGAGTDGLLRRLSDLIDVSSEEEGPEDLRVLEPTIGSDESGKGDYFGSMVVAACRLSPDDVGYVRSLGICDSKQVSREVILGAEARLLDRVATAVVEYEPVEYGELHRRYGNVNRILGFAHAEVIRRLAEGSASRRAIVDKFGADRHVLDALGSVADRLEVRQIPRAEAHPAVAAASFVARARFLRSLERLSERVGFELLPGASHGVEERAREIFARGGEALLAQVAKLHFKTTERVVGPI